MAHLYAMCRSDAPGAIKIGRSDDPARRAHDLQAGHFFTMKVLARVEDAGDLERSVHAALQDRRIPGPGVEWFRCSLDEALMAIARVLGGGEEPDTEMDDESLSPSGGSGGIVISKWHAYRLHKQLLSGTTKGGQPLTEGVARSHLARLKARALVMSERYRPAELAWIAEVERILDAAGGAGEAGEA